MTYAEEFTRFTPPDKAITLTNTIGFTSTRHVRALFAYFWLPRGPWAMSALQWMAIICQNPVKRVPEAFFEFSGVVWMTMNFFPSIYRPHKLKMSKITFF